jgi:hypothetical protein
MARECMSTCYVLLWIVVVHASDPKDLFIKRVTMSTAQSTWLIWVGLVRSHVDFPVLQIFGTEGQDATS